MLVGRVGSFTQGTAAKGNPAPGQPFGSFRFWDTDAFAQDSWKVKSNLTLEYGVRFGYWTNNQELNGLGGYFTGDVNLSSPAGSPEIRQAARVTETLLPVLGVAPLLGRLFNADDMRWQQHRVTILSHRLLHERYGGDPAVVAVRML